MSVIAIRLEPSEEYGHIWTMASDTQITAGNEQQTIEHVKLFKVDEDFAIGTAGSAEEGAIVKMLAHKLRPSRPDVDAMMEWLMAINATLEEATGHKSENHYLIIFEGHAFFMEGFFIYPIQGFDAIGSGSVYAKTALYLGADVNQAVDVAIFFDIFCSGPTQYLSMEASEACLTG